MVILNKKRINRMEINLNNYDGVLAKSFPDNQPHLNIKDIKEGETVNVICSITSCVKLIQLCQVANIIDNAFAIKGTLQIPYLMAARFDRIMEHGDSFDLKVVASIINNLGFRKIEIFEPHSDVSLALINNSIARSSSFLATYYNKSDSILIVPDAGASKKVDSYLKHNSKIIDVVHCVKKRDLSNGVITLKVLEPDKCLDRNCVIIDDLCDGGGTFIAIAEQIRPKNLTLIVAHGIFSKGFKHLEKHFNEIIVTNSYQSYFKNNYSTNIVQEIELF